MAQYRKQVPPKVKGDLRREAGQKCANPGCSAPRTHVHHIRHWAVYQSHDKRYMIAICPTCHDAVHNGELEITDETLYRWKGIVRESVTRGHLYVEPKANPAVTLGTNQLLGPADGFIPFELSPNNRCSIRILNDEILLVSLRITTLTGVEVVRFDENHWKSSEGDLVRVKQAPGHLRITTFDFSEFLPEWVVRGIHTIDSDYSLGKELLLLDMEVMEPGRVKVQGLWVDRNIALVATSTAFFVVGNGRTNQPVASFIANCTIDLRRNGIVSPTIFRISVNEETGEFVIRMGY